jgi:hypothetical protein
VPLVGEPAGQPLDGPLWTVGKPGGDDPHGKGQHAGGPHQPLCLCWLGGDPVLAGDPADQGDALVEVEPVQRHPVHTGQGRQPAPAGQQHRAPGTAGHQPAHLPGVEHVVEQHEDPPPGRDGTKQRRPLVEAVGDIAVLNAQGAQEPAEHRGGTGRVVRHPTQVGVELTVRVVRTHLGGHLDGERGLADTTKPDDAGDHRVARRGQRLGERGGDAVPAGEVRKHCRQLGGHRRGRVDRGRGRRRGVGSQDALVLSTQPGPGTDAEFLVQQAPRIGEHRERVGLATGLVQRTHEQLTRPLAQWLRGGQLVQLTDHAQVPAVLDVHRQPDLRRGQPQLAQPPPLPLGVRPWHPGERHTVPTGQCGAQQLAGRPLAAQFPSPRDEPLHHRQVDRVDGHAQGVPVGDRLQQPRRHPGCAPRFEQPPQPGDIGPHHGHRRPRRLPTPHPVHDLLDRHRPALAQQQHREDGPLLRRPETELHPVTPRPHGTEQGKPQRGRCVARRLVHPVPPSRADRTIDALSV